MKDRRYILLSVTVAAATFLVTALLLNVTQRKQEARQTHLDLVKLTEDTVDPAEWGKNFPREYDGYVRTVDTQRTKYGGSEAYDKLKADPRLKRMFAGFFARLPRGARARLLLARSGRDGAREAAPADRKLPALPRFRAAGLSQAGRRGHHEGLRGHVRHALGRGV